MKNFVTNHPHLAALVTWGPFWLGVSVLLGGCECGIAWPCPSK